jgi:hypothetical protein
VKTPAFILLSKSSRLAVAYPLCHLNIGLAQSINVWYNADNHKAASLIELERMTTPNKECAAWGEKQMFDAAILPCAPS